MLATKPLDIRPDHAEIIHKILKDNLEEGAYIFAFGSRANWTAKQSSDLDLAIDGFGVKLDKKIKSNLEDAFEESDLPYKVDVVDLNSVSESFREAIQDQLVRVLWDWNEYQLKDCCQINPKVTLKSNLSYPFVDMQSIAPFTKFVYARTSKVFTGGGAKFQNGDVLMTRITPCLENGKCSQYVANSDIDVAFGSTEFIVLRSKEHITNQSFIYYLAISDLIRKEAISLMTGTSGRQRVDLDGFKEINITLPPLPEQKRIAEILSSLDNKIEINKQINQTLEEMAEALFKSWFIDFDPVHVKKAVLEAGAGEEEANLAVMKFISSKTDEELEKFQNDYPEKYRELEDVAKLFPAEFQGSELGEVPLGWRVGKFTDISEILSGGTPKTEVQEYWNGEIPFFTPKDARDSTYVLNTEKNITEMGLSRCNSRLYSQNTIFITARGTVGKCVLAARDMAMNQSCYAITGRAGISNLFLFLFTKKLVNRIEQFASGAVFDAITISSFESLEVHIPPIILIQNFDKVIKPIFTKIRDNSEQIQSLALNHDQLLPRLMRGEVRFIK
ncbi:MAG: restriction endonuclease subunit S [bacterium]